MDDFTRGALEMQRVAAEAMDTHAREAEKLIKVVSTGLDRSIATTQIKQMVVCYTQAAAEIRSIKIQDAVK